MCMCKQFATCFQTFVKKKKKNIFVYAKTYHLFLFKVFSEVLGKCLILLVLQNEASIAYFKIRNEGAVEISRKFVF